MNQKSVKILLGWLTVVLFLLSGGYHLFKESGSKRDSDSLHLTVGLPPVPRISLPLQEQSRFREVTDRFNKGDNLSTVLSRYNISRAEIHQIAQAVKDKIQLNRIKADTSFILFFDRTDDSLRALHIRTDKRTMLKIRRDAEGIWNSELIEIETRIELKRGSGEIEESLWRASMDAGIPGSIVLDMADLFGWQIDFTTEIRKGDWFKLLYETETVLDEEPFPGMIRAAEFVNQSRKFCIYSYTFPDETTEFYDGDGQSVRRTFLKSPLRYRYISSGFTYHRRHPILRVVRPHLGIDYAAPAGTPVSALGDGTVIFRGWKGGYGNTVRIRHGDAYETNYGHLSRFGKGIRKGVKVRQGQVIGYVGSTGLSTGPHLDFRVQYRGKYINPLSLDSPPAEPIPEANRDDFLVQKERWRALLDSGTS